MWKVTATKQAAKELVKLPKKVGLIYQALVEDLECEGPYPFGWDTKPLKGREEIRIRLNREYRVLILVVEPDLIVVKVAHRKEVYE
jgi:mRNA-degrading endonuclease RelE of RelBE toxin-antitoxin system